MSLRHLARSIALSFVPAGWRASVARDLRDELTAGRIGEIAFCVQAVGIGMRLRVARARDWPSTMAPRFELTNYGRDPFMRTFGRDLRFAVRSAFTRPGYSLAVIWTLAVGIGATTAVFSVFNWILFRPVPGVRAPERLVTIQFGQPGRSIRFFAYRDFADLRDGVTALQGLAVWRDTSVDLFARGAEPARIRAAVVTSNYFDVLGVRPQLGRAFSGGEEFPIASTPPVVIAHSLARRLFPDRGDLLGRPLTIGRQPFVIVGVMPRGFGGTSLVFTTEMWLPLGAFPLLPQGGKPDFYTSRSAGMFFEAVGRMRPDVAVDIVRQQAAAVAASVPDFANSGASAIQPIVRGGIGFDETTRGRLQSVFNPMMASVALILVLACANAANLLLARSIARRREVAVCQAIGATRARIVAQQLLEGFTLAAAAALVGLFLGFTLANAFGEMRVLPHLPPLGSIGVDWRVAALAAALSLATALAFALVPALATTGGTLLPALREAPGSSRHARPLLRSGLASLQIAISIVLLLTAGLFLRTLANMRAIDLGLDPRGLVSFSIDPSSHGYSEQRAGEYLRRAVASIREIPGVQSAAFAWSAPFGSNVARLGFTRPGSSEKYTPNSNQVTPGYFQTMGIPLLAGRDFTEQDVPDAPSVTRGVAIVSSSLARRGFPLGDAVGSTIEVRQPKGMLLEIVGVVGDVRGRQITGDPPEVIYEPIGQPFATTWGTVHVRSSIPAADTVGAIRAALQTLDPSVPLYDVETFDAALDRVLAEPRLFARLTALFGAIAALIAAIGVYSMMAGAVAERKREFGIRLALGARTADVIAIVVGRAFVVALFGLTAGLAVAAVARRLVEARLYGVTSSDPGVIAIALAAVVALTGAASLIPALRAARVDPVRTLRIE